MSSDFSQKLNNGLTKGETAANDAVGDRRRKENVRETREWEGEREKEDRGHHQAQPVHGQIVMHTVGEKV